MLYLPVCLSLDLVRIAIGIAANYLLRRVETLRRFQIDYERQPSQMAIGFRIKGLIMKLHSMWQEYPALQADLSAPCNWWKIIKTKKQEVEQAILSMIHSGGKTAASCLSAALFCLWQWQRSRESRRIGGFWSRSPHSRWSTTISSIMRTPASSCRPFVPNLATMSLSMLVITSSSAALNWWRIMPAPWKACRWIPVVWKKSGRRIRANEQTIWFVRHCRRIT